MFVKENPDRKEKVRDVRNFRGPSGNVTWTSRAGWAKAGVNLISSGKVSVISLFKSLIIVISTL